MGEFRMPSLGADMEAGTVIEWRVHPGDTVHRGDIVAVIDTEKSDIEAEIFEDGVVEALLVETGVQVPVGTPLARLAPVGAEAPTAPPAAEAAAAVAGAVSAVSAVSASSAPGPAEEAPAPPAAPLPARPAKPPRRARTARRPRQPEVTPGFVRASPLARRRAGEMGVDLATVTGSAHGGAVRAADLAAPAPAEGARLPVPPAERPARREADRQAAAKRATGNLMARSKREIPHFYLATTIDMSAALAWLADINATRPVNQRVLPAALLLKATALAAREVPVVNGTYDDGFRPSAAVHLGVAVSLRGGGLVAPAIHDADRLEIGEMMAALRDLVARARAGTLRSSEVAEATLTVTNLGEQGVEEVFGVIYAPQVALVGFGRILERPWAVNGMLGVRPTVRATLSADHRVTDGHEGGRFLAALDRLLGTPADL